LIFDRAGLAAASGTDAVGLVELEQARLVNEIGLLGWAGFFALFGLLSTVTPWFGRSARRRRRGSLLLLRQLLDQSKCPLQVLRVALERLEFRALGLKHPLERQCPGNGMVGTVEERMAF
jgi:hypothetical protein